MELVNASRYEAAYAQGIKVSGQEVLVVAVKGTFQISGSTEKNGESATDVVPLNYADSFTGEPGDSAPLSEADFAPLKHKCDVIVNGCAYAPANGLAKRVTVGINVGAVSKSFDVVGDRTWVDGTKDISRLDIEPFKCMPITYDRAYGGVDEYADDDAKKKVFWQNPVGSGYHLKVPGKTTHAISLPNTEESGRPIIALAGDYRPMSFGVIARHWHPRGAFAGTYDENWVKHIRPFLPEDFDEAFYQCAPEDQQIAFLEGGENVELFNLDKSGYTQFQIPNVELPVTFKKRDGEKILGKCNADTLVIEPDRNLFTITWRAHLNLKVQMQEVEQVVVGKISPAWWRAQEQGKTYYPSLKELVSPKDYMDEG